MSEITFTTVAVDGDDAEAFLQGQLTCDVTKVDKEPTLGAYCDVKGRVLSNFWIHKADNGFRLYVPEGMAELTASTLQKYGAFSKVTVTKMRGHEAAIPVDRFYYILSEVAFILPQTSLLFTPQMISWEKHGGVSFEKGCYLGQEVVARTQHLGKLKRHLHRFQCHITLASAGDKIFNEHEEAVGVICDVTSGGQWMRGLAVIQDKAISEKMFINHEVVLLVS